MPTPLVPVKLPPKQELFCNYYVESRNATQSYKRAYANNESSINSLGAMGCKLLRNNKIRKRIDQLTKEIHLDAHIKPMVVLNEYADLAFNNIADMINSDGTMKELKKLTRGQKKSIKKIKRTENKRYGKDGEVVGETVVTEIELHDKIKALDSLANFTGVLKPETVNQMFVQINAEQNNLVTINPDDLPVEMLEAIIESEQEKQETEP